MTPKQMLLEHVWTGDLAGYVSDAMAAGTSWRDLAAAVSATTGLTVSHESLRQWYGDKETAA